MQSGALGGDVIPLLPRLPRSPRPGGYATATGGGDAGEREAVGTIRERLGTGGGNQKEGHMSGIKK